MFKANSTAVGEIAYIVIERTVGLFLIMPMQTPALCKLFTYLFHCPVDNERWLHWVIFILSSRQYSNLSNVLLNSVQSVQPQNKPKLHGQKMTSCW